MLTIEVVYVAADRQTIHVALELQLGAKVIDALNASGIYESHTETQKMPVGIYAKQVGLDTLLNDGDRVELYRPLSLDPKEKRRQKARVKK